jgi:hypothetical protein
MTDDEIISRGDSIFGPGRYPSEYRVLEFARAIEAATLERAAQVADDMDYDPDGSIAKAIRAMKGKEE